jgi:hypothetical protein
LGVTVIVNDSVIARNSGRANGCRWDEATCAFAASGGHLAVLQWARANGCPWDRWTCEGQARQHPEVHQWARANGCPYTKKI